MSGNDNLEVTVMATHKLLLLPGDGIGPEVMFCPATVSAPK